MGRSLCKSLDSAPLLRRVGKGLGGVRDPRLEESYKIQALDRAVVLLQVLSSSAEALTLTQVAANAGLHKSTAQRFLRVLHAHLLVHRRTDGRYHLGLGLHEFGKRALQQFDPRDKAVGPMRRLAFEVNETCALTVLRENEVICVERAFSENVSRYLPPLSLTSPAHLSAAGRAILAFSDSVVLDSALRKMFSAQKSYSTGQTKDLSQELKDIRAAGYALDDGQHIKGVRSIAAPVFGSAGLPVAAIAISGPAFRMKFAKMEISANRLMLCCAHISEELRR